MNETTDIPILPSFSPREILLKFPGEVDEDFPCFLTQDEFEEKVAFLKSVRPGHDDEIDRAMGPGPGKAPANVAENG
jgi:hypothetical protein